MASDAENPFPERKRPAHWPALDTGTRSTLQFVTVCTKDRAPLLANPEAHACLREVWARAENLHHVGRYLLMPDHVHFFCSPASLPPESLARWMSFWKSESARVWPRRVAKLWQRDFWDTQLRNGDHYSERWRYVRDNPVRAGLVANPDDWPYQGEIHPLWWND